MALIGAMLLCACEIDDRALCESEDASQNEASCPEPSHRTYSFKVDYTTANGNRPDGRYGYWPTAFATTDAEAEAEALQALQYTFNTTQSYVNSEASEIVYYRGNICGTGFTLKHNLGDFVVKQVRRTGPHSFDYDLELTCTN